MKHLGLLQIVMKYIFQGSSIVKKSDKTRTKAPYLPIYINILHLNHLNNFLSIFSIKVLISTWIKAILSSTKPNFAVEKSIIIISF